MGGGRGAVEDESGGAAEDEDEAGGKFAAGSEPSAREQARWSAVDSMGGRRRRERDHTFQRSILAPFFLMR